jgi:raffinose/stachyose/melibiose transport system permease protein
MELLKRNPWTILWGLLPALLLYLLFVIAPILRSFWYGFFDWNGLSQPVFNGVDNFAKILNDPVFWQSLKNNLYVVVASVLLQIPLGLLAAVLLNGQVKASRFFRTAFFIPMVLSTVVVGLLWSTLLNSQAGPVNALLMMMGVGFNQTPDWLGDPQLAIFTLCGVIVWQFVGLYMIIFLAALQNIPDELLEAASIDGATPSDQLWRIQLPLVWPTVIASVVLCISGSMRSFDLIFVMTQGGPANATEVMATYMYNKTFAVSQYGYGSAVSLVISIISFGLILVSRAGLTRKEEE